jgi:arylsulfatase A-like enzyme
MPGGNVVFVVMDTVRKDRLSIYGSDEPTTPALETVADEATVFEQAVAPAPWTLPVHATLFTGLYPGEHEASQERPYLEDVTTLAETLSAASYDTACYSSNAWITPYTGLTAGFDDQDNFFEVLPSDLFSGPLARAWKAMNDNDRLRAVADKLVELGNTVHEYLAGGDRRSSKTPEAIDQAIDFIDGTSDDWFVFLNLMDAHLPYHPPEEYAERFAPGVDSSAVCQNSKEFNAGARDIDDEEWGAIRGLYDAEIRHIDAELERLWTWLRDQDLWEETLVIVCADHGELLGEHGLYGHEFCIYDPLVNVPLLVKHPELRAERRDDQVELLDLYHTVLDHTGVSEPVGAEPLDRGRSLLREDYRTFDDAAHAYVEYSRPVVELNQLESKAAAAGIELEEDSRFYSRMRAVRRSDAKYIRNERIPDEFYRLDQDPDELENLAGDGTEAEAELEATLAAFEARVGHWGSDPAGDDVLAEMSTDAQDRLRDLGYIE